MEQGPKSETCVCGSPDWHAMIDDRVVWCRRCGSARVIFEGLWHVPLDRAGELARSIPPPDTEEELPTRPGTPDAKR